MDNASPLLFSVSRRNGRFFRHFPAWLALFGVCCLTQCGKTKGLVTKVKTTVLGTEPANKPAAPATSGAVLVVADGRAPAFQAVASHLELGGHVFSFRERLGKSPDVCVLLDKLIALAPPELRAKMPKDFSFAQAAEALGLAGVQASGTSERLRSNGVYHRRNFAYIPQPRTGLLSLTGNTSRRLLTLDLAPKNTDIAVEFTLRFQDLFQTVVPYLEKTLPKEQAQKLRATLDAPVMAIGMPSLQKLLEQIDCRVAFFSRLDPSQPATNFPSGVKLAASESAVVIENVDWLVKAIRAQLMPLLKSPGSPVDVKDSEEILEVAFKSEIGAGPFALKPTFRFDAKLNRLVIATSTPIMNEVVEAAGHFRNQPDFAQAWEGLPEDGSAAIYLSAQQQKTFSQSFLSQLAESAKTRDVPGTDTDQMLKTIESLFKSEGTSPTAFVMSNLDDGVLFTGNTAVPAVNDDSLITIASIGIISAIALPNIASINEAAHEAQRKREAKQASTAKNPLINHLRAYARLHSGNYPTALTQLMEAGIVNDEADIKVRDPKTGNLKDWLYNARLTPTSAPSELAFASPFVQDDGTRLVIYHDGSVQFMTEQDLEQLIRSQQPAPTASQSMR